MSRSGHFDTLGHAGHPSYTWRRHVRVHRAGPVRSARCVRCVNSGHSGMSDYVNSGMSDLTSLARQGLGPRQGKAGQNRDKKRHQKRHPPYTHICTHVHTCHAPMYPPGTRVHLADLPVYCYRSRPVRHARTGHGAHFRKFPVLHTRDTSGRPMAFCSQITGLHSDQLTV